MKRIALGLMRIDKMTVEEVEDLLKYALSNDVTFLDLADIYGRYQCENLVGEVFKRNPDMRAKFHVQTKVGINKWGFGYNSSYEYLMKMTKNCIERLNCGYLDSLLIHRPDILMEADEVAKAVEDLQSQGLIREFGVSNFNPTEIEYLKSELKTKIMYNQVQVGIGNTTMIDQVMYTNIPHEKVQKGPDNLFFYLKKEHITIQAWSPFLVGFFNGSIFDKERYPQIANTLEKYAEIYGATPAGIATAFLLKLDKNLIVITGSTKKEHLKDVFEADKIPLSHDDWYRIYTEVGHILP